MLLQQLLEMKKTHDECSDEIDAYHAVALTSLEELEELVGTDMTAETQQKLLKDAIKHLKLAIALAKDWSRRCG
jgi:uncharacterized coiled-coil DUF342 family protein